MKRGLIKVVGLMIVLGVFMIPSYLSADDPVPTVDEIPRVSSSILDRIKGLFGMEVALPEMPANIIVEHEKDAFDPVMSSDGRYVYFRSIFSTLNPRWYRFDRAAQDIFPGDSYSYGLSAGESCVGYLKLGRSAPKGPWLGGHTLGSQTSVFFTPEKILYLPQAKVAVSDDCKYLVYADDWPYSNFQRRPFDSVGGGDEISELVSKIGNIPLVRPAGGDDVLASYKPYLSARPDDPEGAVVSNNGNVILFPVERHAGVELYMRKMNQASAVRIELTESVKSWDMSADGKWAVVEVPCEMDCTSTLKLVDLETMNIHPFAGSSVPEGNLSDPSISGLNTYQIQPGNIMEYYTIAFVHDGQVSVIFMTISHHADGNVPNLQGIRGLGEGSDPDVSSRNSVIAYVCPDQGMDKICVKRRTIFTEQ